MKNLMRFSLFAMVFSQALVVRAAVFNWATVETAAATGDTTPGMSSMANYSAYYLTTAAAEEIFMSSALAMVTDYLKANYESGRSGVAAGGTELKAGSYGLGQYGFTEYSAAAVSGQDYLAILFYDKAENHEFRVFGSDSATTYDTSVAFDDLTAPAGTFSTWITPEDVPEPASGLLLVIAVAGLALKRKRKCLGVSGRRQE